MKFRGTPLTFLKCMRRSVLSLHSCPLFYLRPLIPVLKRFQHQFPAQYSLIRQRFEATALPAGFRTHQVSLHLTALMYLTSR